MYEILFPICGSFLLILVAVWFWIKFLFIDREELPSCNWLAPVTCRGKGSCHWLARLTMSLWIDLRSESDSSDHFPPL